MLPPSSLTTTNRTSGRGSSGPTTSPVASCSSVRSPSSAVTGAPEPQATPTAVETSPSMPARPRLANTAGAAAPTGARSRSRTGFEEPTTSTSVDPSAARTTAATSGPVSASEPASSESSRARVRSSASRHRANHARSASPGSGQLDVVDHRRRGTSRVGPVGVRGRHDELDVRAGEQLADRPRQRGVADDDHPFHLGAEAGQQQPVRAEGRGPGAGVARGLGQQRHGRRRGPGGPGPTDGRRCVPRDHHGARSRVRAGAAPAGPAGGGR